MRTRNLCILLCALCSLAKNSLGAESVQGAVVTRTEGGASFLELQTSPKQKGNNAIIFEKSTYFKRELKKGDRPSNGDVIVTDTSGKVRLIFRNGDQITVTPSTAYKFTWDPATNKNAVAEILYGDIRAVIQPGGPREGLKVKTKAAVMGVRGTDFYASAWGGAGGSKVAVIRGKVAVAALDTAGKTLKETEIPAGSTGVIKPTVPVPASAQHDTAKKPTIETPAEVLIQQTSREQLVVIQTDSKVATATTAKSDASDSTKKELAELEKQAVTTTMNDIQKYDPALYTELSKDAAKGTQIDSDVLQSESVKKIFATAPSETKDVRKPTLQDLDSGGDIYEKYKWKNEQND